MQVNATNPDQKTWQLILLFTNLTLCGFFAGTKCPYYPAPINGGIVEKYFIGGSIVSPFCNKGFDFATQPSQFYYCLEDGAWITWPVPNAMPWPDCTSMSYVFIKWACCFLIPVYVSKLIYSWRIWKTCYTDKVVILSYSSFSSETKSNFG